MGAQSFLFSAPTAESRCGWEGRSAPVHPSLSPKTSKALQLIAPVPLLPVFLCQRCHGREPNVTQSSGAWGLAGLQHLLGGTHGPEVKFLLEERMAPEVPRCTTKWFVVPIKAGLIRQPAAHHAGYLLQCSAAALGCVPPVLLEHQSPTSTALQHGAEHFHSTKASLTPHR